MGLEIDRERFDEADYQHFGERLRSEIAVLRALLARPGFGVGPTTIGAELEVHLVDAAGRPAPFNREVLAQSIDPRVTLELNRFNLEINTRPVPLDADPFAQLAAQLEDALAAVRSAAGRCGARVVIVGILPTLKEADLGREALTAARRYRALSAGLRRLRREPFTLHISGTDELAITADDITFEGNECVVPDPSSGRTRGFCAHVQCSTACHRRGAGCRR